MRPSCLLLSALLTSVAQSQIYKEIDEQGNVRFTDQPSAVAEPLTVQPANTATSTEARPRPQQKTKPAIPYQQLAITEPSNNSIIPNGPGNFSVSIKLSPNLRPSHQLQLLMNGEVHSSGQQTQFQLNNIRRGSHQLQAQVIDEDGSALIQSDNIKVQVYRPSSKRNRATPGINPPPNTRPIPSP